MANDMVVKTTPIQLDRDRALVFDLNAFALMEDYYPTAEEAFTAVEEGSFKAVRAVLWAGLQREATDAGEVLTLDAVGRMVALEDMPSVSQALLAALSSAVPSPKKGKPQGEARPAKKPAKTQE